ncbi:MAG TPA: PrsW family glutamic-type intramembrane protease [Anaerolineales bacterium]|nr:PrsW family glutamic-type intramembrane protease [Anaerolineales bacterium]
MNENGIVLTPERKIPSRRAFHWPSFLMVVLTFFSLLGLFGGAVAMLFGGMVSLFDVYTNPYDTASLFSYTAAGILLGVLLVPTLVLNIQRLSGKPVTSRLLTGRLNKLPLWMLLAAYVLVIAAGTFLIRFEDWLWMTMPLINVFSLALPVLIFAVLGLRKLRGGSIQTVWSAFSVSLVFSPAVIFIIEIIGIIASLIVFWQIGDAWFPEQFGPIIETFMRLGEGTPTEIENAVQQLLQKKEVLWMVFAFLSIFVPIIEELLKPAALLLRLRRPITPQEGWVLGLLGGAGFGLLENLGNVTIMEDWTFVTVARFGATALHMFNTGLIGYTYALARNKKRYLPLVLAVPAAFIIHGAWNGIIIFANIGALDMGDVRWPVGYTAALVGLALVLISGIFLMNRKLWPDADSVIPEISSESEIE